uniref:Uncharacterized protein n=1 Tax=Anguilla anguilla TaxID=7936 RepID=A0A0E9PR07_ANGAN
MYNLPIRFMILVLSGSEKRAECISDTEL